ncbi:putative D-lactate dehydrogenase (cytochrome) [uncultured Desulfobacterium sp.]|uniref:Putative D-lactate dehydrogenase (Cytochrome) n=1 Tax=uncultured Desulfobacterium sp. TaxID=201089 RepID=A0A445MYI5_9BACT|nr:putative D-lactate dehydrogenase (cytochrome) [uncultured Desulfobacterium sp.]
MSHHLLYSELCKIVGTRYVADNDFALWACSRDSSAYPARVPGVVVRPGSTEEVSEIVRLANREKVPIIPRGGGTQYGGWPPGEPGRTICVDMTRMNRIIEVNETNSTVTVEAGITGSELEGRLKQRGLYTHTTFSPPDSVTVGGALCGVFGGGGRMFGSAATNHHSIVGVKAVLPNGEIIETGSRTNRHCSMFYRGAFGPDLTGIFIGSMGIFGIVTEVTQELRRLQPHAGEGAAVYGHERLDQAYQALIQMGLYEPKIFSMGGIFGLAPFDMKNKDWMLIYQCVGYTKKEVEEKLNTAGRIIRDAAEPDAWQPDELVQMAKENFGFAHDFSSAWKRLGMWTMVEFLCPRDISLRIFKEIPAFIVAELSGWEGRVFGSGSVMFLHGDQYYLAFTLHHRETDPDARAKALGVAHKADLMGLQMGGLKLVLNKDVGDVCAEMIPSAYADWLRTLKTAMDPNNIMNPHMMGLP